MPHHYPFSGFYMYLEVSLYRMEYSNSLAFTLDSAAANNKHSQSRPHHFVYEGSSQIQTNCFTLIRSDPLEELSPETICQGCPSLQSRKRQRLPCLPLYSPFLSCLLSPVQIRFPGCAYDLEGKYKYEL